MALDKNKLKGLYPGTENFLYEPMLIHNSTDSQLKNASESGEYFGQLKKDGALYQLVKVPNNTFLFGRTMSKKTGVLTEKSANIPHIVDAVSCLPDNTVILGEIYYPGKESKDVVSIMGCLPKKAIERQNGLYGKIHFYIYDILAFDGINFVKAEVPNELRYKILEKIFKKYHLDEYDFLELAEVWYDRLYERIGEALSAGEEGMVIKRKEGIYQPGKRPMDNLKAKKVDYIDAFIMGFEKPTELYYGKEIDSWKYWRHKETGELIIDFKADDNDYEPLTKPFFMGWYNARINIGAFDNDGKIVCIGTIHSGISDEMKEDMSKNPNNYIGKVCKIQCMQLDKDAKTIRHGFFRGMRDDKDWKDCTIASIF